MPLDPKKFQELVDNGLPEEKVTKQPEESLLDKAKNFGESAINTLENVAESTGTFIENTATDIHDAYHNMLNAQLEVTGAYTNDAVAKANSTGDYSAQEKSVADIQDAGKRFAYSPFKEITHDIVKYADDNGSVLQELGQNLRRSEANVNYYMNDSEKLAKAIDIQKETGIDAQSILGDNDAYKKALEIYDYTKKNRAVDGSMDKIWADFPGLKDLAQKDPQSAALALHDIDNVRQTKTIVESFTKMLEYGNRQLEYKNLNYKLANGKATDADKARIAEIKQMDTEPILPSFLDNPLAHVAAGIAGSAPEMLQALGKAKDDFLIGAAASAAVGAIIGTAVGPEGTLAGAALGGLEGGVSNAIRGYLMRRAAITSMKVVGGYAFRYGMLTGIAKPAIGGYVAQYRDMKDSNGKRLLTDESAIDYAVVNGFLNAGIEMLNFGIFKKALFGNVYKDTVKEIVSRAQAQATANQGIKEFLNNRAASILEVTASESAEEGLQSVSDDLVHNQIESDTGDKSNQVFTAKDIAAHAVTQMGQAIPAAIGYGFMGSLGGGISETTGLTRSLKRNLDDNAKHETSMRKTFAGTMMLEQLQQTVRDSKLKKTAPSVQQQLIRKQVQGTGFEIAYIDTQTALEKESGRADLEKLAKAGGYTDEDLQTAIDTQGTLAVPVEKFAQAETSPDVLQSVSFDNESEPIAKMAKTAQQITTEMNEKIKRSINNQLNLTDAIINETFPEGISDDEQRELARAAIYTNPENPQAGWRELYNKAAAEKAEIIAPALASLKAGINGVDIIPGEDGGGIRASKNDAWYRDFYKKNKRPPTQKELEDMAVDMMTGKETAPQVLGWQIESPEDLKSLQENEQALSALNNQISNLDVIKDKMSKLNGVEMRLTQGLTPEGYSVYRQLTGQLQKAGGKTARAARMDAILFARHADIVAKITAEKTGKNFTSIDYYKERFGLDTKKQGSFNQQESQQKLQQDEQNFAESVDDFMNNKLSGKNINVMTTPLVMKLAGAPVLPIRMDKSILYKILKGKHNQQITPEIIKQVPRALTDPMLIARSFDDKGNVIDNERIVALDLKDSEGNNIIIPFILNIQKQHYSINKIKSIYGKESLNWFDNRINEKYLLYINKKKTTDWAQSIGAPNGSQRHSTISNLSNLNIPNETDLVNMKNDNRSFYQNNMGTISKMSDGRRVISLYENADESTFLHEMGHFFLMDLDELAKIDDSSKTQLDIVNDWANWHENAAKEYKDTPWAKEFNTRHKNILAAHDAGDIETENKLKEQWRHERFARAFETYLKSGKAPAKGLKAVFRKFKQFLRDIYIGFTSTGGTASPRVEAIMSRMIASEEEINEAALDDRYKDITKAGGEKLLSETEEQTYKRWHDEAIAEAKEKLTAVIMQDLKEETQRKVTQRVAAERAKKEEELSLLNIYVAQTAVQQAHDESIALNWYPSIEAYHEELKNTPSLETALNDYMDKYQKQLDQDMMNSHITDENIASAMESTPYHNKLIAMESRIFAEKEKLVNRIDSKTKMAMQDVTDKINALPDNIDLKIDKEDEGVKQVMAAINKLRFASKWTAKDFSRIASMVESSTKEQIQQALTDFKSKARTDDINRQAIEKAQEGRLQLYKEMAGTALNDKPIFQATNVVSYRKQEKQHAKNVQSAIKAKNWNLAMKQKEAQYISAAMAQQAQKNKEHIDSLVKKVDRQLKTRIKLPAQEKYWHKHLAYLLRLTKDDANAPVDGIHPIENIFNDLTASLDLEYMPSEILTTAQDSNFKGYQSMKANEFEDAVEALTVLYTTGRDKFKMKTIGGKEISDVIDEILNDSTGYISTRVNQRSANPDTGGIGYNDILAKAPLIGETLARGGAKYLNTMIKPEQLIKMIGEKAHKYLYGTYERASRHEAKLTADNINKIKEMLSDYSHKEKINWKKKSYQFTDKNDLYSKEQIICMALNLGNDINTSRLIMGLSNNIPVTESEVRSFVYSHMTKKDWELVQNIWDHLHSFWKDTVQVEQDLNGVILKPQTPRAFEATLPNGETIQLHGGYYPIAADPEKSVRAEEKTINEAAARQMSGAQVLGTGRGFTKARSEHALERMVRLDFDVIPEHLGSVIHNITHRIAARDVYRLINDTRFTEHIQGTMGIDAYKTLKKWAEDVWNILPENNNQATKMTEGILGKLRRNTTMAIMGYRLFPVLENGTNIAVIMDKLGATNALSAVGDFYANRREYTDLLYKSVFMRNRINNMDRDIKSFPDLFNENKLVTGWLKENAYTMMMYSDLMFSAPLWCRSYKDAYEGNLSKVIAENEANKKEFADAQKNLSDINARIYDLNNDLRSLKTETDNRRFMVLPENLDAKWKGYTSSDLQAESVNKAAELDDLKKKLFDAQIKLDNATDLQILNEQEILKEAEQRSIETADGAVRDTFGSGEIKDQASIQKGGEKEKLFTAFYSFFNTQANAILESYYKSKHDTTSGRITRWMPAAKSVLYRILLTSALSTMMRMAFLGDGSDDKEKYRTEKDAKGNKTKVEIPFMERFLSQLGKNTLSTAAGALWGVRDVANFYINMKFDGTDYGRGISMGGVTTQAAIRISTLSKLLINKNERDLKIADQEAKEAARYHKMSRTQRKKYDENKKYKHPVKRITYTDILKSGLNAASTLPGIGAANTGLTDTVINSVLTTMQYMENTDGRYDPTLKNIIWSALFNKKPVEREIPDKPKQTKHKRGGKK